MPGFAGRQAHLLKALQLALRTADLGGGIGDVELGHLSAGDTAGVGHVKADRDSRSGGGRCRNLELREAEGGIAQPKAEGKERVLAGGGPVAVTHHQAVLVLHVGNDVIDRRLVVFGHVQLCIRAFDGVVVWRRGVFLPTAVEADRQLALGIVLAEENFGDGRAALLAGISSVRQRGVSMPPPAVRVTMVRGLVAATASISASCPQGSAKVRSLPSRSVSGLKPTATMTKSAAAARVFASAAMRSVS